VKRKGKDGSDMIFDSYDAFALTGKSAWIDAQAIV